MEILFSAPYIVRVLVSLLIILVVNKYMKHLWAAVLIGTAFLALWSGHGLINIYHISWARISSPNTIFFGIIIFQIVWLSSQMTFTNVMSDLVGAVKSIVSHRTSMAMLPAIIGFLPMPGGAIFSAPLVDECDEDGEVEPLLKTKINYWFRHVWEYWWPLYPVVLLTSDITGLSIVQVMVVNIPLSIVAIWAGYFFLLRKVKNDEKKESTGKENDNIFLLILPILIIIGTFTIIKFIFPGISHFNKYLPMIIGIFLAQIALQIYRPLKIDQWIHVLLTPNTVKMSGLVILILLYGSFITSSLPDGSLLVTHMRNELAGIGIPIFLIIIMIPFICGFITGLAIGYVGASFPIVLSLIGADPSLGELLSTTVLAFGAGYTGMILSPVHICLVVTSEHFDTSVTTSLIRLIKPASHIMIASIVMYIIIRIAV